MTIREWIPSRRWDLIRRDGTAAVLIAAFSVASTFFGFIREMAIARVYGVTAHTDAFFAAFTLISFLFFLFAGGAVQNSFMPTYQSRIENNEQNLAAPLLRWVTLRIGLLTSTLALILFLSAEEVVRFVYSGFDEGAVDAATTMTRILCPLIVLASLGNVAQAVLHSQRRFFIPAMIPAASNIIIISGILGLGWRFGIFSLAISYVLGYILWILLFFFIFTSFRSSKEPISNLDRRFVTGSFIFLSSLIIFDQLSGLVQRSLLSQFEPGLISAFTFGTRIAGLPVGILAGALAIVLFPQLISYINTPPKDSSRSLISFGAIIMLTLILPPAIFLVLESSVVASTFLGPSSRSASAVANMAQIITIYAASLPAQAMILYLGKVYVAAGQAAKLLIISVAAGSVQIVLTFVLSSTIGWTGIPLATLVYAYLHTSLLLFWLFRFVDTDRRTTLKTLKSLTTVLGAGFVSALIWLAPLEPTLISTIARGVIFILLYGFILGISGERAVLELFRRPRRRQLLNTPPLR